MGSSTKVVAFKSAAEFLEALRPTGHRWIGSKQAWLFRGHADSKWPLRPAAFRPECWTKLGGHPGEYCNNQTGDFEIGELVLFGRGLDRVGLPIPGMTRAQLASWDRSGNDITEAWVEQFTDLMALAQHHGFPTRLLDFTQQPLIAAYFASLSLPEWDSLEVDPPEELCVWAIDAKRLYRKSKEWCRLVRATKAGNPNLKAQDGVFIVWENPSMTLDKILDGLEEEWADNDEDGDEGPSAFQLTLPRTQSVELLGLLAREHVTGDQLFPGPEGVIRGHYEQKVHRVYPPDADLGSWLDFWHSQLGEVNRPRRNELSPYVRVRVPNDVRDRLRRLKESRLGEGCTTDSLVLEALNLLFEKIGTSPVRE